MFISRTLGAMLVAAIFAGGLGVSAARAQTSGAASPGAAGTQSNGSTMIGQVTGFDISVSGPSRTLASGNEQTIAFAGGATIVVHSGKARVEFAGGGELDVCGPAKFEVLESGQALTVAVSFGRVHARFDASRPVSIYSPLIVATPIAVMDQPRDFTLGLPATGAMCVLAAHGAIQVQQQLTGDTTIIPQPSEVLLEGAQLSASPAAAGSCRCEFDDETAQHSPATPAIVPAQPTLLAPRSTSAEIAKPSTPSRAEVVAAPSPTARLKQPSTVEMPPIAYHEKEKNKIQAGAFVPEETISVATLLLAKDADVQPDWIFHGEVVEPAHAKQDPQSSKAIKKEGFWSRFRDWLIGPKRQT